MKAITQKLTDISGRLARLMPVSSRGGDTLLTPMGGIKVEGMDDADRILSSPGSDGYRILDGGILWCGECDNVKHEGGELTVASGHVETTAPGIVRARTGARITIAHWVRVPRGASELEVGLRGALVPVLCGQARLFLATPRGDGPLPVKEELPEKLLPARLAASCGEAMDLQEMLGDFRLWRIAAPLNALRKVPGGWETTKAIVLEEITGREAIAQ